MLIWMLITAIVLYRFNKKKAAKIVSILAVIFFYATSTAWLPKYLAARLEKKYQPLDPLSFKQEGSGKIYIHLLGSGYNLDERLPATAQLGLVAQGRLVEALRLYRQINNSILVCSGGSVAGFLSQAAVAKKAALLLGADSSRVITLDTPNTTKEEAAALAAKIGINATVIIVTDGLHMPRAIQLFSNLGVKTIAAPTNFNVYQGKEGISIKWWPNIVNLAITDKVLHEYLGALKARL